MPKTDRNKRVDGNAIGLVCHLFTNLLDVRANAQFTEKKIQLNGICALQLFNQND